jgi:hypothetical protein
VEVVRRLCAVCAPSALQQQTASKKREQDPLHVAESLDVFKTKTILQSNAAQTPYGVHCLPDRRRQGTDPMPREIM